MNLRFAMGSDVGEAEDSALILLYHTFPAFCFTYASLAANRLIWPGLKSTYNYVCVDASNGLHLDGGNIIENYNK